MTTAELTTEYPGFEAELAALDFAELEAKHAVRLDDDYRNILIIDNLPVCEAHKDEKLLGALQKKFFGPAEAALVEGGVFMPRGEDGMSKGYGFFEFGSVAQAEAAYRAVHQGRLDKNHLLYAIRFNDFDRLAALDETPVAPVIEEYREQEYLRDWLSDPLARDQFAVLGAGNSVQVCWGPRNGAPEVVKEHTPWTDAFIQWSSQGSYLVTVHGPGVQLWGGQSWKRVGQFSHANVKHIIFSPLETYMVTYALPNPASPAEPNVLVWDVRADVRVRGLCVAAPAEGAAWPQLVFSADEKYAAWAYADQLALYDTAAGFALLDRKAMEVPGIREAAWAPTGHKLLYWVPETENNPARVALIEVPSRVVLRTKNLFNVDACSFHWQSEGAYLAVQVNRYAGKTRKTLLTNLEVFRLLDKNIPVECLEFKEPLMAVAWEPCGDRLLVAYQAEHKAHVLLYSFAGEGYRLLHTVERKQVDRFLWSPAGGYLVMADLGSAAAFVEFWSAADMSLMATKEHYLATDCLWDPSGRYVVTHVSSWKSCNDNGYCIWDMKGELVTKQTCARLAAFKWRPRPAPLLSAAQLREIKKNYRRHAERFEQADLLASNDENLGQAGVRLKAVLVWNEFRRACAARVAAGAARRGELQPAGEARSALAEEWLEEVTDEQTTYL